MQEILELCVKLDTHAEKVYSDLAAACPDMEVATVFEQMAKEERQHVEWWTELLDAWRAGLLPDIADEHGMLERLHDIEQELEHTITPDCADLSADDMLSISAHLEFYMLDPVFGELIDLMQPGSTVEHRESYARHVLRLVEAIETHHGGGDLAAFLARVLRRSYRDQQRLAALATRDQLTGLYNRRGLYSHLAQWLSWSRRYGRPIGIALVDIDRFKDINDTYGHIGGDHALEQLARALEMAMRASDIVGRFGGDEFLVLAPEIEENELAALLDRIVNVARETSVSAGEASVPITVSAGGAWVPGGMPVTPDLAIVTADRSLYDAKAEGRDRAGAVLHAASVTPA